MSKGFNCKVNESKYFPKELKAMKDLAIKVAKEYKSQAPVAQPQAQAQDPITLIGLQIAEAASAGDMDKVMALTTALNALKSAQSTEPQAPVEEEEEPAEELNVDEEIANLDC